MFLLVALDSEAEHFEAFGCGRAVFRAPERFNLFEVAVWIRVAPSQMSTSTAVSGWVLSQAQPWVALQSAASKNR